MIYTNSNDSIKSASKRVYINLLNLPALKRLMKTRIRYPWALNPPVHTQWRMYPIPVALPLPGTKGRRMNRQAYWRNLPAVMRNDAGLIHL